MENENRGPPFSHAIQSSPYPTLMHNSLAVPKTFHPVFFHCAFSFLYSPLLFCSLFLLISISALHFFLCISFFSSLFCSFLLFSFLLSFSLLFLYFPLFPSSLSPLLLNYQWSIRHNCGGIWIFYIKQPFWELKSITQVSTVHHWW